MVHRDLESDVFDLKQALLVILEALMDEPNLSESTKHAADHALKQL